MTHKTKIFLALAIFLWASAFVGIRAGLEEYSPEGLALLRYLIASMCMAIICYIKPHDGAMPFRDRLGLMLIGAIGIGLYNIMLNYGELTVPSGTASFIVSQSPIITAFFAIIFFSEKMTSYHAIGFLISMLGVMLIALGENGLALSWDTGLSYIIFATLASSTYTLLQKPYLQKYHAISATAYVIYGGTLFLLFYFPVLLKDFEIVSVQATALVIYLGIFPAALGYVAWSYALAELPASRAASFLYFTPFIATMIGWVWLHEIPVLLSLIGGLLAIFGVWVVNRRAVSSVIKEEKLTG